MGYDKASSRTPSRVIVSGVAPRLRHHFAPSLEEAIPEELMALVRRLDARSDAVKTDAAEARVESEFESATA